MPIMPRLTLGATTYVYIKLKAAMAMAKKKTRKGPAMNARKL
jgi:hypothetical protein